MDQFDQTIRCDICGRLIEVKVVRVVRAWHEVPTGWKVADTLPGWDGLCFACPACVPVPDEQRDAAIRRAQAAEAQRDALLSVLPELEWHRHENEETGEVWHSCPMCMGGKPDHKPGCLVKKAKEKTS